MTTTTPELTPAGVKIDALPGEIDFMEGIAANESGWDYDRAQGSPPGSVEPPSASVGGGYGYYQFQVGTDQWNEANAQGWSPAAQDQIADQMIKGYYAEFGGSQNPDIWADVTEAWYGPGTVGTASNDVLTSSDAPSSADWANVSAALEGHPNLPQSIVFGPGYKGGLTPGELAHEMHAGKATRAELTDWEHFGGALNPVGDVASAVGVLKDVGTAASPSNWLKIALYAVAGLAGVGIIGLGLYVAAKPEVDDTARSAARAGAEGVAA